MRGNPDMFINVTPSDSVLHTEMAYLLVTGAGDVILKSRVGPGTITIAATAGQIIPFGGGYVMAASTATGIKGFGYGS